MMNRDNFEQMFRSDEESAKVHPNDHQGMVLTLLKEKEEAFLAKHKLETLYG